MVVLQKCIPTSLITISTNNCDVLQGNEDTTVLVFSDLHLQSSTIITYKQRLYFRRRPYSLNVNIDYFGFHLGLGNYNIQHTVFQFSLDLSSLAVIGQVKSGTVGAVPFGRPRVLFLALKL